MSLREAGVELLPATTFLDESPRAAGLIAGREIERAAKKRTSISVSRSRKKLADWISAKRSS